MFSSYWLSSAMGDMVIVLLAGKQGARRLLRQIDGLEVALAAETSNRTRGLNGAESRGDECVANPDLVLSGGTSDMRCKG